MGTDTESINILSSISEQAEQLRTEPAPPRQTNGRFQAATLPPHELEDLIKGALINPLEEMQPPPVCLQIADSGSMTTVCTLGNFSLSIGKAKSRKTFLTALVFSIVSGHKTDKFSGWLPADRCKAIYFDTEQSKYHVSKLLKRVCRLVGQDNPPNIQIYNLRKFSPNVRRQMIEHVIYNTPNVGFVVIDGIRDLVTSINDEEQATGITTDLLKWTEERDIHIMTVLHQNKGDNNARGHLGAELTNKAETVLSISKNEDDKTNSIVESEYSRDRDFSPFAFTINVEELPEIVDNWQPTQAQRRESSNIIQEMGDHNIYKLLTESFAGKPQLKYSELQSQIKVAAATSFNKTIGNNKIIDLITHSKNNKWVIQAADKAPYTLGKYAA